MRAAVIESVPVLHAFSLGSNPAIVVGAIIAVVLLIFIISVYNGLIKKRNQARNGFSQIGVQLQRRHDLIPNLVETAKAFMSHERETLEAVIQARNEAASALQGANNQIGDPGTMQALVGAEMLLNQRLGKLFGLAEAYPDLKSDATMLNLQEELVSTENKVAFARQFYNDTVTAYNTSRETFPQVLIAGLLGFPALELFNLESSAAAQAPSLDFGAQT